MNFIGGASIRLEGDYSLSVCIFPGQLFAGGDGAEAFSILLRDQERPPTTDSNLGTKQTPSSPRGLHTKMTELYFIH